MSKHAPRGGVGEATRYCGRTTIRCRLDDRDEWYICNLSINGKRLGTQRVGVAKWIDKAIDSPEAFDAAARAAVSFAATTYGGKLDPNDCEWDDGSAVIRRRK